MISEVGVRIDQARQHRGLAEIDYVRSSGNFHIAANRGNAFSFDQDDRVDGWNVFPTIDQKTAANCDHAWRAAFASSQRSVAPNSEQTNEN